MRITKILSLAVLAVGSFVRSTTAFADNFAVVPSEYANTTAPGNPEIGEAINGYGSSAGQTLQYVIRGSYLTGLQNQDLTGLTFRLNNNYAPSLPQINYADYTIELSSFSGASLSMTFAANLLNPITVRSGAFSFDAGAFPTGASQSTPNGFGGFITFQTPYSYSAGDLLVSLRHSQPQGPADDPYWSTDAYDSGTSSVIGHDATATIGSTVWPYSPITEFTTAPLNEDGTLATVPEQTSTLTLLGAGILALGGFGRRFTCRMSR
jgi:hypothetical protein